MIDKLIMIGHFYISWDNCEYNSEFNHITNVFLLGRFFWLWIIFICHRKPLDYRWNLLLSPERNLYSDRDYFTHLTNFIGSVPDPKDPNFFGPLGSWSVIYLYGSGSSHQQAKKSGLWIRIHFLRIRIQSLMLEVNTDPDPIWIQGFNDQKC